MAQRNDHNNEFASGAAIIGIIVVAMAAIVAGIIMLVTLWTTIGCLFAWNKPRDWDGGTILPAEARAFVLRGLLFAGIACVFIAFGINRWDWEVTKAGWWCIAITAYVIASIGVQACLWPNDENNELVLFPKRPIPLLPEAVLPESVIDITPGGPVPAPKPFQFAHWDDGEARP